MCLQETCGVAEEYAPTDFRWAGLQFLNSLSFTARHFRLWSPPKQARDKKLNVAAQDSGLREPERIGNDLALACDKEQQRLKMKRAADELGLFLPDWMIAKMAATYDGMTPMERFIAEN